MKHTSPLFFLRQGLGALRILAGLVLFGLLYASCGEATVGEGGGGEETTNNENVNQATALSNGDVHGPNIDHHCPVVPGPGPGPIVPGPPPVVP